MTPLLTVADLVVKWSVDRDCISRLIASGELPAIDISRSKDSKRPSWRFRLDDVESFEQARRSGPKPVNTKTRSAKRPLTRDWVNLPTRSKAK